MSKSGSELLVEYTQMADVLTSPLNETTSMIQSLGLVAIVVRDYDEALGFYIGTLGFELIEDTPVPAQKKRWVVMAPAGSRSSHMLLARAVGDE